MKAKDQQNDSENNYPLKWYKVGGDNPYNAEILDIRSLTLNIVATTDNQSVADNFVESRSSDGSQYQSVDIENAKEYPTNIVYPHNGIQLHGAIYKADSMDIKWDIYAYDEWLYFVKSWTSELIYKVHFSNNLDSLVLDKVITASVEKIASTPDEKETLAAQNVHSILQTHLMNGVWPYKIPEMMKGVPDKSIALHMFAQFGQKATIATFANVIDMKYSED